MSIQRKSTASTAALGVDYVQKLVHMDNSIFNKIDQDNDVGTDVTGHLKTSHSGSIQNQPPERAVMESI